MAVRVQTLAVSTSGGFRMSRRYDRDYDRERSYRRDEDDRGFFNRAGDEVRSWFGDEEAERRRRMDERQRRNEDRSEYGRDYGRGYTSDYERPYGNRYDENERGARTGGTGYYGQDTWRQNLGTRRGTETDSYRDTDWNQRNSQWTQSGERRWESGRQQGIFAGRGPRNYKRSDDRIIEDINERLTRDPNVDATDIEVACQNGEVTLTGAVDNRWAKRRVEDIAEEVWGVREVRNQIRVERWQDRSERVA